MPRSGSRDPRSSDEGRSRDGRSARWDEHRATRRTELVDAAVEAIREHGPGVGMEEIANRAGITKPVLYRHFADRNDLYLAVGKRVADLLTTRLAVDIDSQGGMAQDRVRTIIGTYLALIEHDSALYRFVVRRPLPDRPVETDVVVDYSTLVSLRLARVLREQLRATGHDTGPSEAWAFALVGMVQSAGDWWIERPTMSRRDLTDYLTDLLWGGFGSLVL